MKIRDDLLEKMLDAFDAEMRRILPTGAAEVDEHHDAHASALCAAVSVLLDDVLEVDPTP